jgi:hypothetical protein
MKSNLYTTKSALAILALSLALGTSSCSKTETGAAPPPATPAQAATQLQQVFAAAPPEVKQNATIASEALKTANYEQAIQSLQQITTRKNLTLEQGMAVQQSMVALEQRVLAAAAAGDPAAKRAYELLQSSHRD